MNSLQILCVLGCSFIAAFMAVRGNTSIAATFVAAAIIILAICAKVPR